jgi:broad specificity phosphatase PhoE
MGGSGQSMPETTRVVEFAGAHQSHMKWTGGPGGDIEAISIGDKHYWFSNGKWTEGTVPARLGYRGEDFAQRLSEMVKEVKYIGPETVNGVSSHAYTGTFETTLAGQQWTGTAKVWIGGDDGLIHQTDSDFHVATYSGKSHIVYEYNVNIKVEPPAM